MTRKSGKLQNLSFSKRKSRQVHRCGGAHSTERFQHDAKETAFRNLIKTLESMMDYTHANTFKNRKEGLRRGLKTPPIKIK